MRNETVMITIMLMCAAMGFAYAQQAFATWTACPAPRKP